MIPMRIVETERDDFEEPVVELWRDDEFVGMVFWDDEATVVQIYPDGDGDVKDLDVRELIRVLDLAEQIVSPDYDDDEFSEIRGALRVIEGGEVGDSGTAPEPWDDEDPAVRALMGEFDELAVNRSEDGEGFFPRQAAEAFIARADELDIAIVEMEGFDLEYGRLVQRPNQSMLTRVESPTGWDVFRPAANARATDVLSTWRARDTLVVAFVIQLRSGDTIVA